AVDFGALLATDRLDLGHHLLLGAGNRQDHPLAPFDLLGWGDPQAVVGDAELHQDLDHQVRLGRVVEVGNHPGHALGVRLDPPGPNLWRFHGSLASLAGDTCPGCVLRAADCAQKSLTYRKANHKEAPPGLEPAGSSRSVAGDALSLLP